MMAEVGFKPMPLKRLVWIKFGKGLKGEGGPLFEKNHLGVTY